MTAATSTMFKADALRASHTLNPKPERVTAPLFHESPFFDARDVVQVKYEMLRWVSHEHGSVQRAATTFGFSRVAWYQIRTKYARDGLVGLLPQPQGQANAPQARRLSLRPAIDIATSSSQHREYPASICLATTGARPGVVE